MGEKTEHKTSLDDYLQWGYLNVVVPPDILNEADTNGSSLDESVTNEGGQIQLICVATGVPQPTVCIRCIMCGVVCELYRQLQSDFLLF